MNGASDEVDELKAEVQKLKEECHTKKELNEFLNKANKELLLKSNEAKTLIEQKSLELDAKNEELSEVRQICENFKSDLEEKVSSFRHLNFFNEKLRDEYNEKVKSLKEQNKGLVVALDEATVKIQDVDRNFCSGVEEIQGLKRLLSVMEKKCSEADEIAKASKELKCRDDIIIELEEENRNIKDQLKWKNEQFEHLEEAHELLQNQFRQETVEWESEKSNFLKDLYSLKINLDSETKISEDLRSQLKMCNQALSREESKKKILEIEVFKLRSHFENAVLEFEEAKSKIEKLTLSRDLDIADLRSELGTKEALNKEMKYRISHLELENNELQELLKECREEQIKSAGGVSVKKLENKLKRLEQLHGQCSVNIKKKEAEWNSRCEKMMEVVNGNISDLKNKDIEIEELRKRLECCHYLVEFQNENEKVMLCDETEMGMENNEFHQLGDEISAGFKKDFGMHNGVFDELSKCRANLKEHFEQMETTLRKNSDDILYALELANDELAKKINEINQMKIELQVWKSRAEKVEIHFEESQEILKREKESLVDLVKYQEEKLGNFGKEFVLFDAKIAAKMEDMKALEQEKEHYYQVAEKQDSDIRELKNEISRIKQEFSEREKISAIHARLDTEKLYKQEEERLLKIIKEKNHIIEDFESELLCSFSDVMEFQIKLDIIVEAVKKAKKLNQIEIQEKNKAIRELKKEKQDLCHEIKILKKSLLHSNSQVTELKSELNAQNEVTEEAKNQLSSKNAQIIELQQEKEILLRELMKMITQREDLIVQMEAAYDRICDLSCKDAELTNTFGNIFQNTDNNYKQAIYSVCDELVETRLSASTKSERETSNERSPLKALNQ